MKQPHVWILAGIVALGAFLRFYLITEVPLGLYPDEAMNGNNALEALAAGEFKFFYPENNGREGLFINIQAVSLMLFGATPWALRGVSALFGTLTIVGVYLAARELFQRRGVGLLAAFFLATSYWHVNFSRIGFRAIMVPLLATCALYFLLKGLRRGRVFDIVLAGIFTGLGLHTYIAFRLMAPVLAVPVGASLWQWHKNRSSTTYNLQPATSSCAPCAAALFAFVVFVISLPLFIHFARHPQDFSGRANDVSIFAAASPAQEFVRSSLLTARMLVWGGDCNWRHNFNCAPQLHPLVAAFLAVGIVALLKSGVHRQTKMLLAVWVAAMALPAALTREGMPHALRSIGMVPPLMVLAGLGADRVRLGIMAWIRRQHAAWPQYGAQLTRLRYEWLFLFGLALLLVPLATYRTYFLRWSNHPKTYEAFDTSSYRLGQFLASLPPDTKRYVVVNARGVDVRGVPMPSQTVMFATDSFTPARRQEKNIRYVAVPPGAAPDTAALDASGKTVIAFIDGSDIAGITALREALPDFRIQVPGDFVVLQNF